MKTFSKSFSVIYLFLFLHYVNPSFGQSANDFLISNRIQDYMKHKPAQRVKYLKKNIDGGNVFFIGFVLTDIGSLTREPIDTMFFDVADIDSRIFNVHKKSLQTICKIWKTALRTSLKDTSGGLTALKPDGQFPTTQEDFLELYIKNSSYARVRFLENYLHKMEPALIRLIKSDLDAIFDTRTLDFVNTENITQEELFRKAKEKWLGQ